MALKLIKHNHFFLHTDSMYLFILGSLVANLMMYLFDDDLFTLASCYNFFSVYQIQYKDVFATLSFRDAYTGRRDKWAGVIKDRIVLNGLFNFD